MEIDAVITWVDGEDPDFRAKHARYANDDRSRAVGSSGAEIGFSEVRYHENQELRFCLRSIVRFAPWFRKIWLVTDDQSPAYLDAERLGELGISLVTHKSIFAGYESVLPTFASTSIESMLWRIDGLAERFVYFNDDVFLLGDVEPTAFFDPDPVLRGKIVDLTVPEQAWLHRRRNAATLLGLSPSEMFQESHVPAPLCRSVCEQLFGQYRPAFLANIAHRFRSTEGFAPITLHHNYLLQSSRASIGEKKGVVVLDRAPADSSEGAALALLARLKNPGAKMGCVNDLGTFFAAAPDTFEFLESIFGGPLDIELS